MWWTDMPASDTVPCHYAWSILIPLPLTSDPSWLLPSWVTSQTSLFYSQPSAWRVAAAASCSAHIFLLCHRLHEPGSLWPHWTSGPLPVWHTSEVASRNSFQGYPRPHVPYPSEPCFPWPEAVSPWIQPCSAWSFPPLEFLLRQVPGNSGAPGLECWRKRCRSLSTQLPPPSPHHWQVSPPPPRRHLRSPSEGPSSASWPASSSGTSWQRVIEIGNHTIWAKLAGGSAFTISLTKIQTCSYVSSRCSRHPRHSYRLSDLFSSRCYPRAAQSNIGILTTSSGGAWPLFFAAAQLKPRAASIAGAAPMIDEFRVMRNASCVGR